MVFLKRVNTIFIFPSDINLQELDAAIRLGRLFSALWSLLELVYGNEDYRQQAQELYEKVKVVD